MALAQGELPDSLQQASVTRTAALHFLSHWNQFLLLQEFVPLAEQQPRQTEFFEIREVENAMRLAPLQAGPGEPDMIPLTRQGKRVMRPFFMALRETFPANWAAQVGAIVAGALSPTDDWGAPALADLEAEMGAAQGLLGEAITRTWAHLLALTLGSPSTGFSVTVSGVSHAIAYAVNDNTASAAWNIAATDVIGDLAAFMKAHKDACGLPPTHCLYGDDIAAYIKANDDVKEYSMRNPEFMRSHALPTSDLRIPALDGTGPTELKEIQVGTAYRDASHVVTAMWPADTVTTVTKLPGLFANVTSRNELNERLGGLGSWIYQDPERKSWSVHVTDNRLLALTTPHLVMVHDCS